MWFIDSWSTHPSIAWRLVLECVTDGVSVPSAVTGFWPAVPSAEVIVTSMPSVKPLFGVHDPVLPFVAAYIAMSPSDTESAVVAVGLEVPVLESEAPRGVV